MAGGLAAAFAASLCCLGPLLAVVTGIAGAGLAVFEPLRPYLLALSGVLFVWAGVALYRNREAAACSADGACRLPSRRNLKFLFWVAVGAAVLVASFPWWSKLLV